MTQYSLFGAVVYIIGIAVALAALIVFIKLIQIYQPKIKFFITGLDSNFSFSEIQLLWRTSQICELKEPISLFWSLPSLSRCISEIKNEADSTNKPETIRLLSKLYAFRTHIDAEADKKRGLESTRYLDSNQRLRIILPGKGVFSSRIVNNGHEITISMPTQNGIIPVEGKDWVGKTISVYLWRTKDARYVFDTVVLNNGLFLGRPALFLRHTQNLLRTQKRHSMRAKCNIYANLFIIKEKIINYDAVETKAGYRCLIEDISESGAMIRIGGKGVANIQLKLQFTLEGKLIIMFGIVRTVEYNEDIHQSRLHFQCVHIEPRMKNEVLAFVYNILPQGEKEIYDALSLTSEDEQQDNEALLAFEDITDTDAALSKGVFSVSSTNSFETVEIAAESESTSNNA
ncbi:MAG: PilZ domain-containing protein [Treponema sp.]|nr:PilZ domain-containing protein [Treponema sp.]